jgi:hypothetical protein
MFKFFRSFRQSLLIEGKTGRYIKYAIGEVILVVIGILLALQINTWNEDRKNHQRELKLLNELKTNLQINIRNLDTDIKSQVKSTASIAYLIEYLDNRRPYQDSLATYFYEANYAPDVVLSSSAFETLKSAGLELIRTDSLRSAIINLFEIEYPTLMQQSKRLEDQVWSVTIVPLYQKHIKIDTNGSYIVNNYEMLLNDQEFTNMLSFRKSSTKYKMDAVEKTQG